jgi:hypothetical protein
MVEASAVEASAVEASFWVAEEAASLVVEEAFSDRSPAAEILRTIFHHLACNAEGALPLA